jgi:hypothetical protein
MDDRLLRLGARYETASDDVGLADPEPRAAWIATDGS